MQDELQIPRKSSLNTHFMSKSDKYFTLNAHTKDIVTLQICYGQYGQKLLLQMQILGKLSLYTHIVAQSDQNCTLNVLHSSTTGYCSSILTETIGGWLRFHYDFLDLVQTDDYHADSPWAFLSYMVEYIRAVGKFIRRSEKVVF